MFNNIHLDRRNANGEIIQTLKVPLSYAPRNKFIARIQASPLAYENSFETFLPRMGFEITGVAYDPTRRISLVQQNRSQVTNNLVNSQYAPSPYNIGITLYVYTKNQDDGLQIIEQILPYFNPDYNLTLNAIPDLNIKNDLPILLEGINYEDDYENDFTQRRAIIWSLNFNLKLNFFGPISKQGIIRSATINTFNNENLSNQTSKYTVTTNPGNASITDDFNFVETFEGF